MRQSATKSLKHYAFYGTLLAALLFSLKWLQWRFLIVDNAVDMYVGLIAIFFTILGIWIAKQWLKPSTESAASKDADEVDAINKVALQSLNLSPREYEVLQLLAKGCSNADIAERLFISVSTVKTHASSLYEKLEVKSRTQAISKSKHLKIIE